MFKLLFETAWYSHSSCNWCIVLVMIDNFINSNTIEWVSMAEIKKENNAMTTQIFSQDCQKGRIFQRWKSGESRNHLLSVIWSQNTEVVMSAPSFPLPSGRIPAVGYGCWKVDREKAESLIETVIRTGYRHIDGACNYKNEREARIVNSQSRLQIWA